MDEMSERKEEKKDEGLGGLAALAAIGVAAYLLTRKVEAAPTEAEYPAYEYAAEYPTYAEAPPIEKAPPTPVPTPPIYRAPYPVEGDLAKGDQSDRIYLIQGGKKRWIDSPETFNALGFKWSDVKVFSQEIMNQILEGDPITLAAAPTPPPAAPPTTPPTPVAPPPTWPPEGMLIKGDGSPKVYLIQGGKKRWIDSPETFNALGFKWSDIKVYRQADVDVIPEGDPITLAIPKGPPTPIPTPPTYRAPYPVEGDLAKGDGSPKVYLIQGGKKRWIDSPETFNALGFKWSNVKTFLQARIDQIPEGDPITLPAAPPTTPPTPTAPPAEPVRRAERRRLKGFPERTITELAEEETDKSARTYLDYIIGRVGLRRRLIAPPAVTLGRVELGSLAFREATQIPTRGGRVFSEIFPLVKPRIGLVWRAPAWAPAVGWAPPTREPIPGEVSRPAMPPGLLTVTTPPSAPYVPPAEPIPYRPPMVPVTPTTPPTPVAPPPTWPLVPPPPPFVYRPPGGPGGPTIYGPGFPPGAGTAPPGLPPPEPIPYRPPEIPAPPPAPPPSPPPTEGIAKKVLAFSNVNRRSGLGRS